MVVILLELHTFVVIFLWNRCWYKTSKSYLCVFVPALCHDVLNETFWNIKFYSSQLQLSYNLTMSVCPKTLGQPGDFIILKFGTLWYFDYRLFFRPKMRLNFGDNLETGRIRLKFCTPVPWPNPWGCVFF